MWLVVCTGGRGCYVATGIIIISIMMISVFPLKLGMIEINTMFESKNAELKFQSTYYIIDYCNTSPRKHRILMSVF